MINAAMTFHRAIGLSLSVHVALFGGALAFAHYTGSSVPSGLRSLSVSLVGMDSADRTVSSSAPPMNRREAPQETTVVKETALSQEENMISVTAAGEEADDVPDGSAGAVSSGGGGGASFGYTMEEWGRLQTALERAKIYPRFARERGVEGRVLVRFKVLPTGEIARVAVVQSSGAKILDDASVSTIYRAAPVPYVPGWVEVPMIYRLRGAENR